MIEGNVSFLFELQVIFCKGFNSEMPTKETAAKTEWYFKHVHNNHLASGLSIKYVNVTFDEGDGEYRQFPPHHSGDYQSTGENNLC